MKRYPWCGGGLASGVTGLPTGCHAGENSFLSISPGTKDSTCGDIRVANIRKISSRGPGGDFFRLFSGCRKGGEAEIK